MLKSTDLISEVVAVLRKTVKSRRTHSMEWRESQLRALSIMLDAHGDDFFEAMKTDLGRSNFISDMTEMRQMKRSIKNTIDMLSKYTMPSRCAMPVNVFPAAGYVVQEPLGLVLVISPWNYPLLLSLQPVAGAIAAGNAVLLKPSEISSATSKLLASIIPQYLDQEAIRVVEGGVEETTEILKYKFDHIFYTGSTSVGRIVYQAAAKHLTPVTLELGGKSPVLVDETANLRLTARRILWGKFINCGQICIAPDYCIVLKKIAPKFYDAVKEVYDEMFPTPLQSNVDYGRIINQTHTKRLMSYIDDTDEEELSKRGDILVGGEVDVEEKYVSITVFRNTSLDANIMKDELFGPILPIVEVDSMDEAIDFVNDRPKPLALYLFCNSQGLVDRVTRETSSGQLVVNECLMHFTVENLPFGGVGESGMGSYHGKATFDTFSHNRSVMHQSGSTAMDFYFRYPPYDETRKWLLGFFL